MSDKLFGIFIILALISKIGYSQNLESKIDNLYQVKKNEPGFSIAVFQGNDIILEKQYGSANLDYNIPITSKTLFDVGSIAKQFTAFAILLLEEQGKLSIDESAYKYIENLPRYKKGDPTIEQLLNQTSGVREVDLIAGIADFYMQDMLSQSQMINFITKVKTLNFTPGDYFQYTNTNYVLLAEIVANASGKSFADFLYEDVFKAFKMENTIKKTSTYSIIKNRAIGYQEDEGEFYKTHLHSFIYNGDGQVLTTARDMFKWHMGLKKIKDQYPKLYKKMHTKAKLNNGAEVNYGLGVEFETHNGHKAMGFDGMIIGGFVSKYLYFPELNIAFFTTQNTFEPDFEERFFQLVDLYISQKDRSKDKQEIKQQNQVNLSKKELKQYEGNYLFIGSDDEDRKLNTIKLVDNQLAVLTLDGDVITNLKPLGNHQFLFNDKRIEFDIKSGRKNYKYYDSENQLPWLFETYEPYKYSIEELKEFEGQYFNADLQISKKIKLHNGKLYFYYRNGAWKDEMKSLSKDIFDISFKPIVFKRNKNKQITGLEIMEILFKKI